MATSTIQWVQWGGIVVEAQRKVGENWKEMENKDAHEIVATKYEVNKEAE